MDKKNNGSKTVFNVSLVLVTVIAIWSVVFNDSFTVAANAVFAFLTNDFAWLYLICMLVFLAFDVYVAFGKYGKIRLGGDDSRPEYKNLTWFGLLFVVLREYPIGFLLCIVAIISLCAFFVTSANSGVYVLSMLTSDGDKNPPNNKKIL